VPAGGHRQDLVGEGDAAAIDGQAREGGRKHTRRGVHGKRFTRLD
jgi:hypothetical protein